MRAGAVPNLRRMLITERWLLAALLVLTVVVRGGVLLAMRDNLQDDPDLYRQIGEDLLRHGEYALNEPVAGDESPGLSPTAYRPPLYPIVLSNLPTADGDALSLVKVAVLHLLLGSATVWLTYATARRLIISLGPHSLKHLICPLLAGLLVACDPILLNQQTLVMTETLATFLAILALWCLVRFDAAPSWFNAGLAGGAIGLAILCRPTFLPWLGMVGLVIVVTRGGNSEFRIQNAESATLTDPAWLDGLGLRVANAAALAIVAAAVVSPWVIRNYREFGKPIATTTHGGYTLWLGNNRSFYSWLKNSHADLPWDVERDWTAEQQMEEAVWRTEFLLAARLDPSQVSGEIGADQMHMRLAMKSIEEDLSGFFRACAYRIGQLWSPLPHKLSADESTGRMLLRYATAAWYVGVYLLAAVGVWRLRWKLLARPWLWGVLLCLTFTAVHTFYWSNLRMRAPLIPFVALVAAAALLPSSRETSRN